MVRRSTSILLAVAVLLMGLGNAVNAVLGMIPSKDAKTGFYLGPKTPPSGGAS